MYRVLSKYNLIAILPFQDTYFHAATLHKKVKLSKDLLRLNYLKHSPFMNPDAITLMREKRIMIWFYQKELKTPIIIPESYLLFKQLKNREQNAIYIILGSIVKIIIIKDSELVSVFTLDAIDESVIRLSMDEFNVDKRVDIQTDEYENIKNDALNSLTFKELYLFNQLSIEKKTILKQSVDYASYPVSALIVFAILVSYVQEQMISSKIENLKKTYKIEKSKNFDIKSHIKKHNSQVKKWQNFADKELAYIAPMTLLQSVYNVFKENEQANLIDVSINANKALIIIQTDENPIVFLNKLNEIKYFSRVIIQNTHKPRNAMKIISYDIEIKASKDV